MRSPSLQWSEDDGRLSADSTTVAQHVRLWRVTCSENSLYRTQLQLGILGSKASLWNSADSHVFFRNFEWFWNVDVLPICQKFGGRVTLFHANHGGTSHWGEASATSAVWASAPTCQNSRRPLPLGDTTGTTVRLSSFGYVWWETMFVWRYNDVVIECWAMSNTEAS